MRLNRQSSVGSFIAKPSGILGELSGKPYRQFELVRFARVFVPFQLASLSGIFVVLQCLLIVAGIVLLRPGVAQATAMSMFCDPSSPAGYCTIDFPQGYSGARNATIFAGQYPDESAQLPYRGSFNPWYVCSDPNVGCFWGGVNLPVPTYTWFTGPPSAYWLGLAPRGTPLSNANIDLYLQFNSAGFPVSTAPIVNAPDALTLANLSQAAYLPAGQGNLSGFTDIPFNSSLLGPGPGGYGARVFQNGNQIVISFRGTTLDQGWQSIKELAADGSFASGVPTPQLQEQVKLAAQLAQFVANTFPGSHITLTGWSLGGALAQLVGNASGYSTTAFNAPKVGFDLYNNVSTSLAPALNLNGGPSAGEPNQNFRNDGDIVSQIGPASSIGTTTTLDSAVLTNIPALAQALKGGLVGPIVETYGYLHEISVVIAQLTENATQTVGSVSSNLPPAILGPVSSAGSLALRLAFAIPAAGADLFADPSPAASYTLIGDESSPDFQSLTLPLLAGISAYDVRPESDGSWLQDSLVNPLSPYNFDVGVDGFQIFALDAGGNTIPIDDALVFDVAFASAGKFQGTLSAPFAQTPEPGAIFLFGPGLIGLLWFRLASFRVHPCTRIRIVENIR